MYSDDRPRQRAHRAAPGNVGGMFDETRLQGERDRTGGGTAAHCVSVRRDVNPVTDTVDFDHFAIVGAGQQSHRDLAPSVIRYGSIVARSRPRAQQNACRGA